MKSYFEEHSIASTKENCDFYFEKLDVDKDHTIDKAEFVSFVLKSIESDMLPALTAEMQKRGLEWMMLKYLLMNHRRL